MDYYTNCTSADNWAGSISSERLIVLVASAGGFEAIRRVLSLLPGDFPAAIAVVQHRGAENPDRLIKLLASRTPLKICHATDGALLEWGTVYVCPPGFHMVAERSLRLVVGPKINFVQPNADVFLNSVARIYRERAACVVLSGCGWDGAVGSLAIGGAGGTVIVQTPESCGFGEMPRATANVGAATLQLGPAEIAAALIEMTSGSTSALAQIVARAKTVNTCSSSPTRILLVDDHRILLDGLHLLIDGEPDMNVVGSAEDGECAYREASRLLPDVVIMDVCMPGTNGIEATRRIVAEAPTTKVIALSSHSDAGTMSQILGAGATGYLTKHRAFDELVQAIRSVNEHKVYYSSDVAHFVASGRVSLNNVARHL